jgi:multidrug efflux pump subunit AcrA (membrane-fusion protein)
MPERQEDLLAHRRLVQRVLASGEGVLVAPHSGSGEQGSNPTDFLLVLGPVKVGTETRSVIEIFQRPNPAMKTQRGYLRFLMQMCELAADFLRNRQLRHFTDRQAMWSQLEQFTRSVHGSLDPREVAFTIANEGRRLIDCDRVSVALRRGNKCRIEAISGQDTFDSRSNTVTLLNNLASTVAASGDAVWYSGDTSDFAPQVEEAMQEYVDDSHSKQVGVLPLYRPQALGTVEAEEVVREPLGALIIEQIEDTRVREGLLQRVEVVCDHGGAALGNALEHQHLFLMPVWRAIGKSRWVVEARTLPKTLSIGGGVLLLLLAMFIVPYRYNLASDGTLQPVVRRDVFASVDGTVEEILVHHGQPVHKGQLLAVMRNTDLEVAMEDVTGKRAAAQEQLLSIERAIYNEGKKLSLEERNRLAGQRSELNQQLNSYDQQLELYRAKREKLKVLSPTDGEVTTWNVEQLLKLRPVQQGQLLMSVADPAGDWELELRFPEDRAGALATAINKSEGDPLHVTYRLATDPGTSHQGLVKEVHLTAEPDPDEGNTVLVRVAIDKDDLDYRRPGADVMAKVNCGYRSMGYVWFHDVIAFIQSRVLFKL